MCHDLKFKLFNGAVMQIEIIAYVFQKYPENFVFQQFIILH